MVGHMSDIDHDLTPPQRLALAYAKGDQRDILSFMLRLDARLCNIVGRASEVMIAQMKLAWWRDALSCEPARRPKGEPLLLDFERVSDKIAVAAEQLVSAWELLLVEADWSPEVVAQFALMRGEAVFLTDFPRDLGSEWAASDLRLRFPEKGLGPVSSKVELPRNRVARPLSILAMSVRDISGPRLIWHALTGR